MYRDLLAHASSQFGLFTRSQAHRVGVSDRALQRRVRNGLIEQLPRGVYRIVGTPGSWEQRVLSACLAGGEQCVASHRCAAALHGFDGNRREIVEVTVPRHIRYKSRAAVVHQSLDLAPGDCTMLGPIPVTTPARTLIDLGAVTGWERVEEMFDGAERDSIVVDAVVSRRHAEVRRQGRNGVGPMAVVLEGRGGQPPKYVIERRFLRILERADLPRPECQYPIELPSGRTIYTDAAHVAPKLAWELDGHGAHATRRQRAADHARANEIEDLGWQLRRFTYEQVMHDPALVARAVRNALAARFCGT